MKPSTTTRQALLNVTRMSCIALICFCGSAFAQSDNTDNAVTVLEQKRPSEVNRVQSQIRFQEAVATSSKQSSSGLSTKRPNSNNSLATVYLTEDFETAFTGTPAAPAGWTQTRVVLIGDGTPDIGSSGEKDWARNVWSGTAWTFPSFTASNDPVGAQSGTGTLCIDDSNFGSTTTAGYGSRRMESPIINLSASTSPYVRCYYAYGAASSTLNARVMASSNGGTTWNSIMQITGNGANTWQRINVLIPAAYRTATAKIGFEITNTFGTANIFFDNLTVEDYTPTTITSLATGLWSAVGTWVGGVVPTADNDVVIAPGTVVTSDVNIARMQSLSIDGTLGYSSTSTTALVHVFGNMVVNPGGTYNSFFSTTGKRTYVGGNVVNDGTVNFSIGAGNLVWLGGSPASIGGAGSFSTFISNIWHANSGGVTYNVPIEVRNTVGLYVGSVNPNGNLTVGNSLVLTQTIERASGSFTAAPIFGAGVTRSVSYLASRVNFGPAAAVTTIPGEEVEDIAGTRTIGGTLSVNTDGNVSLAYPVALGTATTGAMTLTRGIVITSPINLLTVSLFIAGSTGTAPSTAALSTTHGSYIAGPLRINFPAAGTTSRNFALGLGTALNGATPNANVKKTAVLANSVAWASQTITASLGASPTGSGVPPVSGIFGVATLRLNLNGGPDLPGTATLNWVGRNSTFGNSDAMIGTQGDLVLTQSTTLLSPIGSWTQRSAVSGSGVFVDNTDYTRTTATAAPGPIGPLATNGEYFALGTVALGMVYDSSTTTQNTSVVTTSSTNQQIIGIRVSTSGALSPLSATRFKLNTTGTTSTADISNAKIFYTGATSTFSAINQFGSTVASPSAPYAINGSQVLLPGTNYFWLTYDIPGGATVNNFVDAECDSVTVNSVNQRPIVTAPAGTRQIKSALAGTYTIGNPVFGLIAGKEFTYERHTRTVLRPVAIESQQNNQTKDQIQNGEPLTRMVEMQEEYWTIMEGGKPYEGPYVLPVTASDRKKYGLDDFVVSTYLTITAALADLNPLGVSGPVNFLLNDATYPAETFPLAINIAGTAPTAVNTVTFKPNTGVTSTISGSSTSSIFQLNGADYITIDGSNSGGTDRSLTISNTNTGTSSAVVWGQSGTSGATHNTLKNLNIVGNAPTTTLVGIGFGSSTISVASAGIDNDSNRVENCSVQAVQHGIYSGGQSALNKNVGNVITKNTIDGISASRVDRNGILVLFEDAVQITQNTITGMSTPTGGDIVGINAGVGNSLISTTFATGSEVSNAVISRNNIGVIQTTSTTGFSAVGIALYGSATGTNVISNNLVSGAISPATSPDFVAGIFAGGAASSTTQIYFNSVSMTGDRGTVASQFPSFALAVYSSTPVDLKDNILYNTQIQGGGGVAGKSYAIALKFASPFTSLTSNYNDLFSSGAQSAFACTGGITGANTDYATLALWIAATAKDSNSISADPLFVSSTNLTPFAGSPVLGAGKPAGGITVDFLGLPRSGTAPSIGAYESGASASMTYTSSTTTQTNTSNVNIGSTNQQIIGMQVVMTGTASPLSATRFYFKTDGSTSASDIANAKVWYTGTSSVFATGTQFGSTVASPSGPFVVNGSQVLAGGTNYFWLSYDISGSAVHGHIVDAQSDSVTVAGTDRIPTVAAPSGTRTITGIAVITAKPDSLVKTLATNSSTTDSVVIKNTGNGPLTWSIADENARPVGQIIGTDRFAVAGPELPKGVDNGTSSGPITDGQGGPDAFGYKWIDSDEPGGPVFGWVDITGTGTVLDSASAWVPTDGTNPRFDEGYFAIALPSSFSYYGVSKDSLFIGTNGNVMFQRPTASIFTNAAFPTAGGAIDNHIGVWWDDMELVQNAKVYYGTSGADFVVLFENIRLYTGTHNGPANYTFEVILSPGGTIKTQYLNMAISGGSLTSSSIGIENATGTVGLGVVNNAAYMHNNLAIKFSLPDAPWLTESPLSGSVNPGDSAKVVITFNSTGLSDSTYRAVLKIASNDPVTPNRNIPVRLIVGGGTTTLNVAIASGWNLISNPVTNPIPGDSVRQLYPTSLNAYAFEFAAGYVQKFKLANGKGYWEKFPGAISNPITGTLRTRDSVSVVTGWNIVGSISNTVDTSTIVSVPAGLRVSNWFGYSAGYTAVTQLVPGKGYWVKSAAPGGKFVLANPLVAKPAQTRTPEVEIADVLNTLTITDANGGSQTLYFGADGQKQIPVAMYTMPPAPPVGAFDARFETADGGSMVQTHGVELSSPVEFAVSVQSEAYPLTITWKVTNASYAFTDGVQSKDMTGEGSTKITNSSVNRFSVKLTGEGGLPKEFALSQNYPNPFNPTTNIKYALPVYSRVTMEIYNVIGQKVRTLVSDNQAAGYHAIEWNSTGTSGQQLGSGVYFLHLSARGVDGASFNEIRKLLLLK